MLKLVDGKSGDAVGGTRLVAGDFIFCKAGECLDVLWKNGRSLLTNSPMIGQTILNAMKRQSCSCQPHMASCGV